MLNVRALPSALADSCASPLTKTYMDVSNPEVMAKIPVSAPGKVPAGRKRRDMWPVLMGNRQCQLVDKAATLTFSSTAVKVCF